MKEFVFVFENWDHSDGENGVFVIQAESQDKALDKIVACLSKRKGFSPDKEDYEDDISNGNITVRIATRV